MNIKKVYSKAIQGYVLLMEAIDFYKEHKEEINTIAKHVGEYAKSVKRLVVKPKSILDPDFKSMGLSKDEVEEFLNDKEIVTVGDFMERFGNDVLNPKIIFGWLIAKGEAERTAPGTYKLIKKGVDA